MNLDALFPYLVAGSTNPSAVLIGHGVWVELCEDVESPAGIVHAPVSLEQLRAAELTADEAHDRALANLVRFADESPELSIQVLGDVGEAVHFLLYSDHPRAAACLLLPDLYEQACDLLKTSEVCAVVPQRESLVVLPTRDRAYRAGVVAKLREIEADAAAPISFGVFEVTADGVRELVE